jgi:hypothetical protein
MSNRRPLHLTVFIDALGWEIVNHYDAFPEFDALRAPVESQFGYSSACVPTILSGASPAEHGHWNFFVRADPDARNAFDEFRWARHLPGPLLRLPGRFANPVNRRLKRHLGMSGYFNIYRVPLQRLHWFDYGEKHNIFNAGAFTTGSIIDDAVASGMNVHWSDWRKPEAERCTDLVAAMAGGDLDWAFLYTADLDGMLHVHGWPNPAIEAAVRDYEARIRSVIAEARRLGYDPRVTIISDHGMSNIRRTVDIRAEVQRGLPGLREGRDYIVFYDSTMARFWPKSATARTQLREFLGNLAPGELLTDAQLREWDVFTPDGRFGELIYLLPPQTLLVPSDMGRKPITGMHGYAPKDADSVAAILSNHDNDGAPRPLKLRDLRAWISRPLVSVTGEDAVTELAPVAAAAREVA